jgi:hypothetical protein
MERRVNVNFCVKLQKSPSETLEMLKTVYGSVSQPLVRGPVPGPRLIKKEFTGPWSHKG